MAGMSRKEIARLLDHIEPQGVTTTRTTKGVLLRMPDGKTDMIHWTTSDHRAADNLRASLRRSGITWPTDGDPISPKIMNSRPQKATLAKVEKALRGYPYRKIGASQLIRLMPEGETLTIPAAQAALYHLGWTPTGPTKARKWLRPLELEPEPEDLTPPLSLVPDDARPAEAPAPEPEPEVKTDGEREFLDSVDSWTADFDQLPEGLTVAQLRQTLGAFGLQLELRTWKA